MCQKTGVVCPLIGHNCCGDISSLHLLFGNIQTDDMEASTGLMIVTVPSKSVLLTPAYIMPVCMCGVWQVFSGRECGSLCVWQTGRVEQQDEHSTTANSSALLNKDELNQRACLSLHSHCLCVVLAFDGFLSLWRLSLKDVSNSASQTFHTASALSVTVPTKSAMNLSGAKLSFAHHIFIYHGGDMEACRFMCNTRKKDMSHHRLYLCTGFSWQPASDWEPQIQV